MDLALESFGEARGGEEPGIFVGELEVAVVLRSRVEARDDGGEGRPVVLRVIRDGELQLGPVGGSGDGDFEIWGDGDRTFGLGVIDDDVGSEKGAARMLPRFDGIEHVPLIKPEPGFHVGLVGDAYVDSAFPGGEARVWFGRNVADYPNETCEGYLDRSSGD